MKFKLLLRKRARWIFISSILVGIALMFELTNGYTTSTSTSSCLSYESGSNTKWCKEYTSTTSGYLCSTSETTGYWGGYSSVRWSTDSSYLPQNAQKLLCPANSYYRKTPCPVPPLSSPPLKLSKSWSLAKILV